MTNKPIRCFDGNAQPHEAFWRMRNAAETGGDPEIELYGVISEYSWFDDDITPKMFKDDLYKLGNGGPITVRIDFAGRRRDRCQCHALDHDRLPRTHHDPYRWVGCQRGGHHRNGRAKGAHHGYCLHDDS